MSLLKNIFPWPDEGDEVKSEPIDDDETLLSDIDDDDALADKLLVRFPTYGTRTAHPLNPTADWLLGGTSNIPNPQALQKQREEEQLQEAKVPVPLPPPVHHAVPDWDENEQSLWKSTTVPTERVRPRALEEEKLEKDPAKDWVMAYYYHTGVVPKEMPPRVAPRTESPIPTTPVTPLAPIEPTRVPDDRQHWMPDRLCKHCYACDTPFTVFRRRHHCRLCGQVFCNACSAYFVKEKKTILRTCKMCFEQMDGKTQMPTLETGKIAVQPISPSLQDQLSESDVLHSMSKKRTESAFSKRLLLSQQQAMELQEQQESARLSKGDTKSALVIPLQTACEDTTLVQQGIQHLGLTAANHLEQLGAALLESDAPLLQNRERWLQKLMLLATKCCATIEPNVKKGDLLDIRPYVKIKGMAS